MTPRERVLAVLRGEKPDKVPFTIYECMIPQCAVERRLRAEGMCIVHRRVSPLKSETPDCRGETFHYVEDGRPRVRTVIHTPVGEVSTVAEPAGFTNWTLERLFKGPDDYEVLRFWAGNKRLAADYDGWVRAEEWMGEDVILRAGVGSAPLHTIMIHWMGVETFAVEWLERRDEVLTLIEAMTAPLEQAYPLLADAPITHANMGGNEAPEVMGPERYRQYVLGHLNRCAEAFHAKGKLLGSHMDANNRAWSADIAGSGLDYIEAFTPAPDTDMTLAEALDAWPDKVIWLNFPSSLHLADLERIKSVTAEFVELGRQTNRVIIGITEDIPADRWQQNLLAISEVINA